MLIAHFYDVRYKEEHEKWMKYDGSNNRSSQPLAVAMTRFNLDETVPTS